MASVEQQAEELSDLMHRQLADASQGVVWLALDGRSPEQQQRSELRQALLARQPVPVSLPHRQVDERLYPAWYRLDVSVASDSAILRLSIELALEELQPPSLRQGGGREIAGWITPLPSNDDPVPIAAYVGRQMIQRRRSNDMLLCLHDPAVLWWLWRFLDGSQRTALLGRVQRWWLLDPADQLVSLEAAPAEAEEQAALMLNEAQWNDVEAIGALNKMLRELAPQTEDLDKNEQVFLSATEAVRRARRHGLTETSDLALFARHAVEVHAQFDAHPLLRALLKRREPDDFYSRLVAEVDDDAWRQVRHDCANQFSSA